MTRPRLVGGRDPEPPDPQRTLAPVTGPFPYSLRWWRRFAHLARREFTDTVRTASRRTP